MLILIKSLILDQVITKIFNVIIAISYAICNTVDTCWLVDWQTLMLYKKLFFSQDNAIKVLHFW